MAGIDSISKGAECANRVWITGTAFLAGGSSSIPEIWGALANDEVLAIAPPSLSDLALDAGLDSGDARILSRTQLLALSVVERAWRSARLSPSRNKLRGEGSKIRHPRLGVVAGSSLGGLCAMDHDTRDASDPTPYALSRWRGNSVGAAVALRFGCGGADFSSNAASATGAQTLYLAAMLVRSGVLDAVVAVAADQAPTEGVLEAMQANRSVTHSSEARPLGTLRKGMNSLPKSSRAMSRLTRKNSGRSSTPRERPGSMESKSPAFVGFSAGACRGSRRSSEPPVTLWALRD
jgi:3-oxoacyl-[acyl-carrier-protein] synthase II